MDSSQGGKLPSSKSNMSYLGSFGLQRAMLLLARGALGMPVGLSADEIVIYRETLNIRLSARFTPLWHRLPNLRGISKILE